MATAFAQSDLPRPVEDLAVYVTDLVTDWERYREVNFDHRWNEYHRMWRGIWAAEDSNRQSERSKAMMPVVQQAVDSATAELVEATFGRERWFDAVDERSNAAADRLLEDTWNWKTPISEAYLNGSIFGTIIAKLVVNDDKSIDAVSIDPRDLVVDPAGTNPMTCHGLAHVMYVPKALVEEKQEMGFYEQVPLEPAVLDQQRMHLDSNLSVPWGTDVIRLVEYHGFVPAKFLSDAPSDTIGPDGLVDAIVTIANDNDVLRESANPYTSRAIFACQHDMVPRVFWGRGIPEKGYWPAKVLDTEIRARNDALAFSVHPMMVINRGQVPRGERFAVRPGRNIFVTGDVRQQISPITFPPPDPQTYTQATEMERMVEMATGQLQATSPMAVNERNATATGMSMMMGASIRRTRKTLANIERQFLDPMIRGLHERKVALISSYPKTANLKIVSALGIMAKEFEITSMSQLMNSLKDGPSQLALLRLIVQNSSLADREEVLQIIEMSILQSLQPQDQGPGPAEMARLLSAETKAKEAQINAMEKEVKAQLAAEKLQIEREKDQHLHERQMIDVSTQAEKAEAEIQKLKSESVLNVAKAEAEELGTQLGSYRAMIEALSTVPPRSPEAPSSPEGGTETPTLGGDGPSQIEALMARLEALENRGNQPGASPQDEPIEVVRNPDGLIESVGGRAVQRDARGLIAGLS